MRALEPRSGSACSVTCANNASCFSTTWNHEPDIALIVRRFNTEAHIPHGARAVPVATVQKHAKSEEWVANILCTHVTWPMTSRPRPSPLNKLSIPHARRPSLAASEACGETARSAWEPSPDALAEKKTQEEIFRVSASFAIKATFSHQGHRLTDGPFRNLHSASTFAGTAKISPYYRRVLCSTYHGVVAGLGMLESATTLCDMSCFSTTNTKHSGSVYDEGPFCDFVQRVGPMEKYNELKFSAAGNSNHCCMKRGTLERTRSAGVPPTRATF